MSSINVDMYEAHHRRSLLEDHGAPCKLLMLLSGGNLRMNSLDWLGPLALIPVLWVLTGHASPFDLFFSLVMFCNLYISGNHFV